MIKPADKNHESQIIYPSGNKENRKVMKTAYYSSRVPVNKQSFIWTWEWRRKKNVMEIPDLS